MIKKTRLIKFLLLLIIIITGSFGYYHAKYIAPYDFKIKNTTIENEKLPKEFKDFTIAFISDINLKNSEDISRLKNIINTLNKQSADMVIFGGDLFDTSPFDNSTIINLLSKIESSYGKFAVLGEKDLASLNDVSVILNEGGFEILHNEYRPIYFNNATIGLFGLESSGNIESLLNENNQQLYKIVAVHEPDYFDETSKSDIALQLSGHTMGGYIYLPGIEGILKKINGVNYIHGKYQKNNSQLVISNGLSVENDFSFRLFCPNQINIIKLET